MVLVDIRLAMVRPGPCPRPVASTGGVDESRREVHFDGGWVEATVLRGEPEADTEVGGPAIFELPESTLVVPPGWAASVDETGTIHAERRSGAR